MERNGQELRSVRELAQAAERDADEAEADAREAEARADEIDHAAQSARKAARKARSAATKAREAASIARRTANEAERSRCEYDRALRDYTQLVRHRIANPLTVIEGAADTLLRSPDMDSETRTSLLEAIIEKARAVGRQSLEPNIEDDVEQSLEPRPFARQQ